MPCNAGGTHAALPGDPPARGMLVVSMQSTGTGTCMHSAALGAPGSWGHLAQLQGTVSTVSAALPGGSCSRPPTMVPCHGEARGGGKDETCL